MCFGMVGHRSSCRAREGDMEGGTFYALGFPPVYGFVLRFESGGLERRMRNTEME